MNTAYRLFSHRTNDGVLLAFDDRRATGSGRPPCVVLLPSLFFSRAMFDDVLLHLAPTRRFVVPDHRGQGDSGRGAVPLSIERLALDVITLVEALDCAPVHLVGSSMGGYVALELACRRPELLASVVLSCCTAEAEQQVERFAALEAALRDAGPAASVDALLRTMFGERFLASGGGGAVERWRAHFAALPHEVADAVHGVFTRPSYVDRLPALRVPMLLISGGMDRAKRPEDMALIARHVAGSRHLNFDDCGHTPPVESPQRFAAALEDFWRALERSSSTATPDLSQPTSMPQGGLPT